MNRIFKWVLGIAATPFILFLLLTLLLYCPPVQRWAVGIATQYASEKTGMEISIQDVRLRFPLDLKLNGVKALQRNDSLPQLKDTLINAESITCEVQLRPLFDKNVQVDILEMTGVQLNTASYISDCRVKGRVGQLLFSSHGIDLKRDTLLLNKAFMTNADLDICLSDTAQEDTIKKPNPDWIIKFQNLDVKKSAVLVHMPGDTLNVGAKIASLTARDGIIDLASGVYQIRAVDLNNSSVKYDNRYKTKVKGVDFNHLLLTELNVGVDSFIYKSPDIKFNLRACNAKEKSGLHLATLTGKVNIDSTHIYAENLDLQTAYSDRQPYTRISGNIAMDMNAFSADNPGTLVAKIDGQIGKRDLMLIAGNSLPKELVRRWPDMPATISGNMNGNMKHVRLDNLRLNVPNLAKASVTGDAYNLDNPDNLKLNAKLDVTASGSNGRVVGTVRYGMKRAEYMAKLNINDLNINHFVPNTGMGRFSGVVDVNGHGFDIFSPSTALTADASIRRFRYAQYDLAGSTLKARIKNGMLHADIMTPSDIMRTCLSVDGKVKKRTIDMSVKADVGNIDFYALRLTKNPMQLSMNGSFSLITDLKDNYNLQGSIGNICITDTARRFTPNDIVVDVLTRRDTTHAFVTCGDFKLNGNFNAGYKRLLSVSDNIINEFNRQIDNRIIDEMAVRAKFPEGSIQLKSGRDNPMARMVAMFGYTFADFDADIDVSKVNGLNGYVRVDTLKYKNMQFDDVDLDLTSDLDNMYYSLRVVNGKDNPWVTFSAEMLGEMQPEGTKVSLKVDDAKGRRGVDVDLETVMEMNDIRFSIANDKAILGYAPFKVNKNNYIRMNRDMRVSANMLLKADNGMGIQVYTDDDNLEALQDITLSLNGLNLGDLTAALPFMPNITGGMDGDFHFIMEQDRMSISLDADFTELAYEGSMMGDVSAEIVYMPLDDGSHHVDGVLFKNDEEIATIQGQYSFEGDDMIDANLELTNMPMDYINGFIPQQVMGMKGIGTGTLEVKGYVARPVVNGSLNLSQAKLISVPYGVELQMDKRPVDVVNSSILFKDYQLTASNGSPLVVNGSFNFADLDAMTADLRVKGTNVQIINAKETRKSEAYGKAFVNFTADINGLVSKLNVNANLDVLPSTNLYYVLRDSPLSTDNRLSELVTFTDFNNEQQPVTKLPTVDGITMNMMINVLDGSHITCWLNGNHTNYLDIYGNGELRFRYAQEKMKMTGRYTFTEGEMKYSLPVIPLKTFSISQDSYIEFTGDVMNPTLHITATEHNRATATVDGENTPVDFECGVVISKTLQDMGLEFIISAPSNQTVTEHLSVLSKEEKGKLAVGMLTTGMYMDERSGNVTMNSALSSFLQQEINNITGSALKTLDLSIGLENSTTVDGSMRMDYSFKFAKRFWNNRVSVAIGGRIATGSQSAGTTPSFFDNVEVQYRLSETSNQYLQLFYKHDVYDYLEGYLDHFGAGYMWKRKLQHLSEIFGRKKSETKEMRDSTKQTPISIENETDSI